MEHFINILDICEQGTTQLGPGLRYAIWVQGCPFNCRGCTTPEGIPMRVNKLISIDDIASSIIANPKINGITISGGEPFMQASKLVTLLDKIHAIRPELDVIVYSGFEIKQLDWEEAKKLLGLIDVLIDGKYVEKYDDNRGLRGSSNQKIHFLTMRHQHLRSYFEERARGIDIFIKSNEIQYIGIPNNQIM